MIQNTECLFDRDRINALTELAATNLNLILEELGISNYRYSDRMAYFACPIHGGDNPTALNIYYSGYSVKGFWRCNTKKCHEKCGKTLISFVRATLSANQKDNVSFGKAVDFICRVLGQRLDDIKVDKTYFEQQRFIQNQYVTRQVKSQIGLLTRDQVRAKLKIPAKYYIDQGFDPKILDDYDVGLCEIPNREMTDRIVWPVYDGERRMIGCVGRSIYQKCPKCKCYHSDISPCVSGAANIAMSSKWRNSKTLNTGKHFFNYHRAKDWIIRSGSVIVVEGQADVLKLEMAGIHNGIGLFGSELTDDHQIILEQSGALSVILALDSDEPGKVAREVIAKRLNRFYRIFHVHLTDKDIGAMTVEQIKETILPIVKKADRNG